MEARTSRAERRAEHRRERVVLLLCAVVLFGFFTFHFAATVLYLTPPNPIRIALHRPLERYIHPYFTQSWRLFAPDPGGTDGIVLVECRAHGARAEGEPAFFDVTTPLHQHRYEHRFSPSLMLARAQRPRLFLQASSMHDAIRRYGLPNAVIEEARAELDLAARRRFEVGKVHLYRIASVACDRRSGAGSTAEVRARYLLRKIPPFGARDSGSSDENTSSYDFPWAPYEMVDGY